jgi:adenylosuccinate lyase
MLIAQNDVHGVRIGDGGGSSAMPEKSNPIAAEILVTPARFNAAQLSARFTPPWSTKTNTPAVPGHWNG